MTKTKSTYLALLAILLSPMAANADLITYDFTVTAPDGPLAGTVESGSFSFDSSIIPAGGGSLLLDDLLSVVEFTWNGTDYNAATANTGQMGFLASGELGYAFFGNSCGDGYCNIRPGFDEWTVDTEFGFWYSVEGEEGWRLWSGSVSSTLRESEVPEPGTLALLAIGLLGLGITRKRRASFLGSAQ